MAQSTTRMSKRPFWMHQIVEYILGGAMIAAGLQSPTPVVPSVVGGVIMLNSAITAGPLSAFRVLDRRVHRVIDIVVIAFEMIAAVQPWIELDAGTRGIVLIIAFVHLFVWWNTNYAMRTKRDPVSSEGGRSAEIGRIAGRMVGHGVNVVRRPKSDDR